MVAWTLFLLLAATTAAAPTAGTPTCKSLSTVTDNFDTGVTLVPALPMINGIVGPVPTGTYLKYNNMAYANVGKLSNVRPPSLPNDIYLVGQQNDVHIMPAFNRANTFRLTKFRYGCIYATQATAFEISPRCTFRFTCDVFGGGTRTREFTFYPDSMLGTEFNYGSFTPDFENLTQCNVALVSAEVANAAGTEAAVAATVLVLDNVENQGQVCY